MAVQQCEGGLSQVPAPWLTGQPREAAIADGSPTVGWRDGSAVEVLAALP